jgi:hypothetical protein
MKKPRLAWLTGAVLLVTGGWAIAQQHPDMPPAKVTFASHSQSIPFELFRGNRVIIEARINGQVSEALLDTGASVTVLDKAYARSIGIKEGRKVTGRGAGGVVEAEVVTGVTLEVAGMRFDDMTISVMDMGPVARAIGHPLNMVLGREFFNSAVISIDWAGNKLQVSAPKQFARKAESTELTLKRVGPFNTIPVSIAGAEPIDALLDLGNGGALVLPKTYWGTRPELAHLPFAESRIGGVGGMHSARATTVPKLNLAGATFSAIPATLSDKGNDHDPTQMANVGIGLLKQFHVDLDLGRNRIYLTPRTDAPAFERDRSGTRLDLMGDRLKVAFVSPQGPAAAAGLKEGDEIVAIDGHKITADYYKSRDWARGPAGTAVLLQRADGSSVKVTLADYF